ncbi:MAG TPA: response regulator [Falsiroseomonas sp.]|jgi:signal transduction histidine kinase/ActR/RegA family two-component response regulator|nr:response regulator [Falsiroseomonas sp.]
MHRLRFWRISALRLHAVLLAVSVLVPAALFAFAAAQNRADVLREGEDTVVRTAAILQEHARKVFETQELALARLQDRLRGLTWEQISAPETSAFLAEMQAPLEQAVSMWVTDRDGVVRAGSRPWNSALPINDREFFRVHAEGASGSHVSAAFRGRATRVASFAVSRRLTTPEGAFDGTIHIALSPDYFGHFFAEAAPPLAHAAVLVRSDGAVLAREPAGGPDRLGPDSLLLRAIAAQPAGGVYRGVSRFDTKERIYAYRKLGDYPLYIGFGVQTSAVLERWDENLRLYGAVAGAAAALLLLVSWLAMRRALAERAATERLRQALDDLKRETAGREAAEIRVRQAQRMEALGQLAGGIAHDVNNVLQAAASGARLIGRRPDDAEQVRRLAGMVLEATERGASVARRLLAFARQGELRGADVDAAALLADLKEVLGHTLGAGVTVRTAIAGGLPPLRADKGQLETVLLNLATNARDAMVGRDGGVLTLAAAQDTVAASAMHPAGLAPGAYLRLAVADTGAGMDAATLARATEPFFTTKPPGRGTGLGLAMAKGFAEQSGGGLVIDSEVGRGTTVTLWLPRGAGRVANIVQREVEAAPARPGTSPCVLLVDDEALVRETLCAELTERGWKVLEVADGAAALHALDTGALQPDLLVTDLSMPGMSGLALIREMRRRRPGLPAVLLTGLVGDGAAAQAALAEAVRDGPFALLRKPLDARELAARAEALLHAAGEAAASL